MRSERLYHYILQKREDYGQSSSSPARRSMPETGELEVLGELNIEAERIVHAIELAHLRMRESRLDISGWSFCPVWPGARLARIPGDTCSGAKLRRATCGERQRRD